jgi:DNA-binding CsgD family transcriptional regulator
MQVMALFAGGMTMKQVGRELGISHSTARSLVFESCQRLGTSNRTLGVLAWMRSPQRLNTIADEMHDRYGGDRERWGELVHLVAQATFAVDEPLAQRRSP